MNTVIANPESQNAGRGQISSMIDIKYLILIIDDIRLIGAGQRKMPLQLIQGLGPGFVQG